MAGKLIICPTPIGNLGDMPQRALDALASADVLVMLVDHNEFKAVSGDSVTQAFIVDTKGVWR